jgi:VanZ family protein
VTIRYRYRLLASLWALFILALCAIPGQFIPRVGFIDWLKPDKVVHFVLFGVLSFLLIRAFQQQTTHSRLHQSAGLISAILGSIYGVLIELAQEYVFISRSAELFDVIADAIGAFLGWWFYTILVKRKIIVKAN